MKNPISNQRQPIGSPHTVDPPMFPHFGFKDLSDQSSRDKRIYSRRRKACPVFLIDRQENNVMRCRAEDIGDGGLYGTSPIGYGLGVGQRYEVRIACAEDQQVSSPDLVPSLGFATVTRVEMNVDGGDHHRIGFAMKFDVPQLLPIY